MKQMSDAKLVSQSGRPSTFALTGGRLFAPKRTCFKTGLGGMTADITSTGGGTSGGVPSSHDMLSG